MPTYDYVCDACGHAFEEWQSFKDDALTKCPACKKNKLERLFGGGGAIIFKGSGFYETDYGRGGKKKQTDDAPAAESKPAETKNDTKTEAAPAAKAETGGSMKADGAKKKA